LTNEQTLLEAGEELGLDLPYDCRAGICGTCKARLISGQVVMDTEDALGAGDRKAGRILMCQAHCVGDVIVDA
jgi:ring-1,2-phenylacetyl-CoA epoxidase subunit PaaE